MNTQNILSIVLVLALAESAKENHFSKNNKNAREAKDSKGDSRRKLSAEALPSAPKTRPDGIKLDGSPNFNKKPLRGFSLPPLGPGNENARGQQQSGFLRPQTENAAVLSASESGPGVQRPVVEASAPQPPLSTLANSGNGRSPGSEFAERPQISDPFTVVHGTRAPIGADGISESVRARFVPGGLPQKLTEFALPSNSGRGRNGGGSSKASDQRSAKSRSTTRKSATRTTSPAKRRLATTRRDEDNSGEAADDVTTRRTRIPLASTTRSPAAVDDNGDNDGEENGGQNEARQRQNENRGPQQQGLAKRPNQNGGQKRTLSKLDSAERGDDDKAETSAEASSKSKEQR